MKQYFRRDESHMGEGIKSYCSRPNLNAFMNNFFPPRYAFTASAVITQEKEFPDVSFYQGNISWDMMHSKTDAVIIRAGQNLWIDSKFSINYYEAKARGMKRGVYWFYDDRVSPGKQAELLVSLIKNDLPEMEVWCDWERSYSGGYSGLANVVAFMQAIEAALPTVHIGIYTGYYWFRDHSNAVTNASQYSYLKNKPLWLAWYTSNPANVLIPAPWTSLLLWQRGTPVIYYGQETAEIDMNVFNGTVLQFNERYSVPPIGEPMKYTLKNASTTKTLTVRAAPVVLAYGLSSIAPGASVGGDYLMTHTHDLKVLNAAGVEVLYAKNGDQWLHHSGGWSAVIHLGVVQAELTSQPDEVLNLDNLSIHMTVPVTMVFADDAGNTIATKTGTAENVELR